MSRARMTLLPTPEHMCQADVDAYLKKQVRVDAEQAGWLAECSRKRGLRDSVFYRTRDVQEVSRRIAGANTLARQRRLSRELRSR